MESDVLPLVGNSLGIELCFAGKLSIEGGATMALIPEIRLLYDVAEENLQTGTSLWISHFVVAGGRIDHIMVATFVVVL